MYRRALVYPDWVAKRTSTLIEEIQAEALDPTVPVSSPLRKLVALGGQSGSKELREWAGLELRGYVGTDVPLPDYRHAAVTIQIDGATFNAIITGQPISPSALPDPVNEQIDESVPLNTGVAEIEAMIARAKNDGGGIKLSLPKGQDIVRMMNYLNQKQGGYDRITAIYWAMSQVTLAGVLDQIRTRLVELVAEMRAVMPEEADVPTAAVADNAVSVVIHGGKPHVNVVAQQSSGNGSNTVAAPTPESRSRWFKLGAFVVGAAGVATATAGVAVWLGWNPF